MRPRTPGRNEAMAAAQFQAVDALMHVVVQDDDVHGGAVDMCEAEAASGASLTVKPPSSNMCRASSRISWRRREAAKRLRPQAQAVGCRCRDRCSRFEG